jgi:hypothetical protein
MYRRVMIQFAVVLFVDEAKYHLGVYLFHDMGGDRSL